MPNHNTGNRVDERISDIALDAVVGGTSAKNVFGATWDQLKASAHMALGGSEEALGKLVGDMSFIPGASELGSEWVQTGTGRWMEGLSEATQAQHLEGNDAVTTILATILATAGGAAAGELGGAVLGKVTDPVLSSIYAKLTDLKTSISGSGPADLAQMDSQINGALLDDGHQIGIDDDGVLHTLNETSMQRLKNLLNYNAKIAIRQANDEADDLTGNAGDEHEIQSLREKARELEQHPPGDAVFTKLEEVFRKQPPLGSGGKFLDANDLLQHIIKDPGGALAQEVGLSPEALQSYLLMKTEIVSLTREAIQIARQEKLAQSSANESGLGAVLDHSDSMGGHDLAADDQLHLGPATHNAELNTVAFKAAQHAMKTAIDEYGSVDDLEMIPEMQWNRDMDQFAKANDDLLHQMNDHLELNERQAWRGHDRIGRDGVSRGIHTPDLVKSTFTGAKLSQINEQSIDNAAWLETTRNTDVDVGRFLTTAGDKIRQWMQENKSVNVSNAEVVKQIYEFIQDNDHTILQSDPDEIRRNTTLRLRDHYHVDIETAIERAFDHNEKLVGDARQLKYEYEQERNRLIQHEAQNAAFQKERLGPKKLWNVSRERGVLPTLNEGTGQTGYAESLESPPITAEERRLGEDMGSIRYFARDLSGAEVPQSIPVKSFDVDTITREGASGDHQISTQELHRQYDPQLNNLKRDGFIDDSEETKLIRTLQLARESDFEVGVFELGNGKEVTLTKPNMYGNSVRELAPMQKLELNYFIQDHTVDPSRPSLFQHFRAQFGTTSHILGLIGGVGVVSFHVIADHEIDEGHANTSDIAVSGLSTDIAVSGLGTDEYGAADVTATHEALVASLTEGDAKSILGNIRSYAEVERLSEPGHEPSVQVEMYKVVSDLISGQLEPQDVNVSESFVQQLRLNRGESLHRIQRETQEATEAALNMVTSRHPEWAQKLEAHGTGASNEDKMLDAVNKLVQGDSSITMPKEFISSFEESRRTALLQMPETSLIGAIGPGQEIPVAIGLRAQDLAGTQQMLTLIKQQDEDLQKLQHVTENEKESFFNHLNEESLNQAEHAGIPASLRSVFHGHTGDTNPIEAIALLSLTESIGDHHSNEHFREQQEFIHNYLDIRQHLLDDYIKRTATQ